MSPVASWVWLWLFLSFNPVGAVDCYRLEWVWLNEDGQCVCLQLYFYMGKFSSKRVFLLMVEVEEYSPEIKMHLELTE
tara:strand:+ start:1189 stop:1422 length:234 start_codon:yes stop_codon:yes gene_type:complete